VTTWTSGRAWSTIGAGAGAVTGAVTGVAAAAVGSGVTSIGATVGVGAIVGSGAIVGKAATGNAVSTAGVLVADDEAACAIPIAAMRPNIVVAPSPAAMIRPPAAGWRRRDPVVRGVARAGPDGGGRVWRRSGSMSVIVVGALVLVRVVVVLV
jgi:hypothetical protein